MKSKATLRGAFIQKQCMGALNSNAREGTVVFGSTAATLLQMSVLGVEKNVPNPWPDD